jgi:hypothetical protein
MPHSGKKYTSSPVAGRSSSSRGASWSKYGGAETADVHEGIPTEITIEFDGITVVESSEASSKYEDRPSSAPLPPRAETAPVVEVKRTSEWVSTRSIDGRMYRRRDELITVIG